MSSISPTPAGDRSPVSVLRHWPPAALAVARLHSGMCRWPRGELTAETFAFCGAEAPRGRSYCAVHAALAGARTCRAVPCTAEAVS